jgi:hypothetical protein
MIRFFRSTQGAAASSTPTPVNLVWGPASLGHGSSSGFANYYLDDADDSVAYVLCVPKDGSIVKVGVCCTAITGNPPAYNVGLVTVDAATGYPTTTAYGGSATETYDFTTTGFVWITLNTPASAQAGDIVAIRVWPTASAPDASNRVGLMGAGIIEPASGIPRGMQFSTVWTVFEGWHAFGVEYATGEIVGIPVTAHFDENFDVADSPDEIAAKLTVPATMVCCGARVSAYAITGNASFVVKLYDGAGTALASRTVSDEDEITGGGTTTVYDICWDAVTLSPGTTYRLSIAATHATATIQPHVLVFDLANSKTKNITVPEVTRWSKSKRTNEGEWTDESTKLPWFALLVSSITLPG